LEIKKIKEIVMSNFEIVTGPMRAGKTTYAKSREGYEFISCDAVVSDSDQDSEVFLDKIAQKVSVYDANFIIDGWFSIYNTSADSVKDLQARIPQKIKIVGFYDQMSSLLGRINQLEPASQVYQAKSEILKVYEALIRYYKNDLKDFDFSFRTLESPLSFIEFMKKVREDSITVSAEDIANFEARLAARGHDRYYQTINLPFGRTIQGYERTNLTWSDVARSVDFRGKTVLDVGSYHAYCSFGAEDAGAVSVIGLDASPPAVDTANEIKKIWGYESQFFVKNIDDWNPVGHYDIVMCFNMIQYPKKTQEVIHKLFQVGDIVIFEAHEKYKPMFENQTTHKLFLEQESGRWRDLLRKLYYYKRI
jgi:ribosomal protein L11 methylase PrmA